MSDRVFNTSLELNLFNVTNKASNKYQIQLSTMELSAKMVNI